MTDPGLAAVSIDTSKLHPARMYDYYLGGKDNYPADAKAAEEVIATFPEIRTVARVNRSFMHRATRFLAGECGIRQFLDIGTGIPTEPNLHQVAQSVHPDARIAYADNDPIVLLHAQALLRSTPEGRTTYVQGDVREPEKILSSPELAATLDLGRPVELSLNALMHFVPDEFGPYEIVRTLVDALPSGSYLALTHVTPDFNPEAWEGIEDIYRRGSIPIQFRTRSEVERFFDGLELVDPGVVVAHRWRPDEATTAQNYTDEQVSLYVGVARKP